MAEILDLTKRTVVALTSMPKEAYVTAADAHSMSMGLGSDTGATGERRASLGVVPSYGEDTSDVHGVKISGVSGGSPAEKAGLQGEDVIVGFNDKKLDNLMDLSAALTESKPGDKVKLKVMRAGKPLTLEATLTERH
jgi:S1-C subfamily serine protease